MAKENAGLERAAPGPASALVGKMGKYQTQNSVPVGPSGGKGRLGAPGRSARSGARTNGPGGAQAALARVGLSDGHIWPHGGGACVRVSPDGRLVEWRFKRGPDHRERHWVRGKVRGMSRRSRSRLMRRLAEVDRASPWPLFVTLTYPAEYPDPERAKRDLRAWLKRLRRAFPEAGWFWRMEFQERGAPHFHLLIWGVPWLPYFWVSRTWYEVVGSGDERHLRAGTRVEKVWSWGGVVVYCSKYIAKVDENVPDGWTGRVWGYGGRVPFASVVELVFRGWDGLAGFVRAVRRFLGWDVRLGKGGWFFSSEPSRWLALLVGAPPEGFPGGRREPVPSLVPGA